MVDKILKGIKQSYPVRNHIFNFATETLNFYYE